MFVRCCREDDRVLQLGGSGFNPEASSDSYQGALQSLVIPEKLSWVVDWRVRRALASEELYEDLFVELTLAAAWCYARFLLFPLLSANSCFL